MIKRYPCQAVILYVLGILASKWIVECRKTDTAAGLCGLYWLVPAAFAAMAAAVWVLREASGRKKCRQAVILLLAFAAGMVRMYAAAHTLECSLAGIADGQKVSVQGRITGKQARETQYETTQWTVRLTDSYLKTSQEIRSCKDLILYLDLGSGEPVIGNTILISGKTKLFNEARNDGNFDERAYYQNQGYAMKIYADKHSCQVVDGYTDRLRECLYRLQQRLVRVYQSSMPESEAGAMCAMLLGERSLLSSETKDLYRQSGIAHILAISGLHISILGAAVFRMLRKTGASYPVSAAVSMGLLMLFGLLTGMGLSTARAVIMFGIYLGAACCGRAYDSVNALAAAAAWILLHEPRSLFLAGFQFSFAAVGGVLLGKEVCRIFRPRYRLAETVLVSLSIQMLTIPLTAWYYYEIPVYSVLLNLFVLPLMGAVLLLGLAGGALGMLGTGGALGMPGIGGVLGIQAAGGALGIQVAGGALGMPETGGMLGTQAAGGALGMLGTGGALGMLGTGGALGMPGTGGVLGIQVAGGALGMPGTGGVFQVLAAGSMYELAVPAGMVSRGILYGCTILLRYFSGAGKLFLGFPGAVYVTGQPQVWQMAGYYLLLAGCVFMTAKQGCRPVAADGRSRRRVAAGNVHDGTDDGRKYTVCSCFAVCMCLLFVRLPKQAEVTVLDVGQGDGIYIRTSDGMDVMIDGGSTDIKQAGTYRILPFLKSHGVAEIDYWFLSHLDQDHISGFQEIADSGYPVGEVVLSSDVVKDEAYEKMMNQLSECRIHVRYLEKGDALRAEHACFSCISPVLGGAQDDRNAKSLVLLYEDCGFTGFFSGDISTKEEQQLLAEGNLTKVTFYKAAHHGSRYSNAKELLAQLSPAVSVVSCAGENDYGHPGEEAVANMEAYSSMVEYTMRSGQIRILRRKGGLAIFRRLQSAG